MGAKRDKEPLTEEQRELCSKHLKLARTMAINRRSPFTSPEDRIQDACMGLIDAARDYDPSRGVVFAAYACRRILGAMIDAERERGTTIRTFRGRVPRRCYVASQADAEGKYDGRGSMPGESVLFVAPEPAVTPGDRDAIDVALRSLPDHQRYIVGRYYFSGKPQKQIGRELGLSESRVSQLLTDAEGVLFESPALADYRQGVA